MTVLSQEGNQNSERQEGIRHYEPLTSSLESKPGNEKHLKSSWNLFSVLKPILLRIEVSFSPFLSSYLLRLHRLPDAPDIRNLIRIQFKESRRRVESHTQNEGRGTPFIGRYHLELRLSVTGLQWYSSLHFTPRFIPGTQLLVGGQRGDKQKQVEPKD